MLNQQEHFSPPCPAMGEALNSFLQRRAFLVMKTGRPPRDWKERFWEKVNKNGPVPSHRPELGQCWEWKARIPEHYDHYGRFRLKIGQKLTTVRAHRVAFLIEYGRWPKPFALHSCDNPPCCNPAHLFEGTNQDNLRDASIKGRLRTGETHRNAKLTWEIVDIIRRERKEIGTSSTEFSKRYGVASPQIMAVLHGKTWKPENRPQH